MTDPRMERLVAECDLHLKRIDSAFSKMSAFMPLDAARFRRLTEDEIEHVDQFLFRFAKLQDAIGERLFTSLLDFLGEEHVRAKPFIDILNRLEQLRLLEDKNVWLELRKIRNSIAHQYEDEPMLAAEAINAVYASKHVLETIYARLRTQYLDRIRP